MKLIDWIKSDYSLDDFYSQDRILLKHKDKKVIFDIGFMKNEDLEGDLNPHFPLSQRNVYNYCIIEGGFIVGFNENPSRGWSYPIKSIKKHPFWGKVYKTWYTGSVGDSFETILREELYK